MKKNWSTLKKLDKLYLMVPYEEDEIIKYEFQESQVINIHHYDWCTNIRLKYTDKKINKRRRIELCINKYKYDQIYLAYCNNTKWARDYNPIWGDLIITFVDPYYLNEIYQRLIQNKIKEQEALINSQQIFLEKIKNLKFERIV